MKKLLGTVVVAASLFVMSGIAIPFLSHQQEGVVFANRLTCETNGGTWENDTCVKETKALETKKDDIKKSTVTDADRKLGYLSCSMWEFGCGMVNFLYWIFIIGGNWLVGISATIMDFFLNHSLQSTSYSGSNVIQQGWEILRDATNIVFIFALMMAAFRMVLGQGTSNAKGQVLKIILVALTINFSLYLSFAVIDAGNVLGQVFYNRIEKTDQAYTSITKDLPDVQTEEKSLSVSIANKINPQALFTEENVGGKDNKAQRVLVILMGGIINFTLIGTFLSVSFLFLGRTIGLWFSAILSGLAFATLTIPKLTKQKYFGFDNWLSSLLSASFMAPVFLFFLYLAVTFMNIGIGVAKGTDLVTRIIAIIIPMIFIVILIKTAKEVAQSMAGEFAGQVSAMVTKVAGGALAIGGMAATAGLAATTGGAGAILKASTKKSTSGFGKFVNRTGNRMTRVKSLDVSKLPGFKQVMPKSMTGMASAVGGKSWRGTTDKAAEKKYNALDSWSGRKLAEDEQKRKHKLEDRRAQSTRGDDGVYGWQRGLEKKEAAMPSLA